MNSNWGLGPSDPGFLSKVRQDAKVLTNIIFILEKVESDGFLRVVHAALNAVLENEIVFALRELCKNDPKARAPDLRTQLVNNTYIFKENLKALTGFLSKLTSRPDVEGQGQGGADRANDFPGTGLHPQKRNERDQGRGKREHQLQSGKQKRGFGRSTHQSSTEIRCPAPGPMSVTTPRRKRAGWGVQKNSILEPFAGT